MSAIYALPLADIWYVHASNLNYNVNAFAQLRRAFGILDAARWRCLERVSKIPEYAISGGAAPFLRHKARLSAAKPSGFFLELTQNPLGSANCSDGDTL